MKNRWLFVLPGILAGFYCTSLVALAWAADWSRASLPSSYLLSITIFSVVQASFSMLLSLTGGICVALALNRYTHFIGRRIMIGALGAAATLPAIVVVFGVIALYGRSGFYGSFATALGLEPQSWIFGWPGILIGHVMLNLPFVARSLLLSLAEAPAEPMKTAISLGFSSRDIFRLIEGPIIRREASGLAMLVFLVCFTSFAIVLTLGGGPERSTLEVAVYAALRIEVNFAKALTLILLQTGLCLVLVWPFLLRRRNLRQEGQQRFQVKREDRRGFFGISMDITAILIMFLIVFPPFLALAGYATAWRSLVDWRVGQAFVTSLGIACASGSLAALLGLLLALHVSRPRAAFLSAHLPLVIPAFGLMAGLFVLVRSMADPFVIAIPIVILINALTALPFAYRLIEPAAFLAEQRFGRLSGALGLKGSMRWRIVHGPFVKHPVLAAFSLATAFSFGDFGIIAFFGGGDILTLPLLLSDRLGSYRMAEAGAIALVLAIVSFALSWFAAHSQNPSIRVAHAAG
jgi:thiamine transport system permease protein